MQPIKRIGHVYLSIFIFIIATCFPAASFAKITAGAGVGFLYGGGGINVGIKTKSSLYTLAAGCKALKYDSINSFQGACGLGIGATWAGWFNKEAQQNGIGVSATPVSHKSNDGELRRARYGAGFHYVYFWEGVDKPSGNFGIGVFPIVEKDDPANGYIIFQLGYQF